MDCWRSLFYIAVVCIAIVSARDGDNATTNGTMYPDCVNETCPMPRCRPVALDFTSIPTEVYSRDNVICLNQTGPRTPIYRLTGCPDTFSSTIERIEGVCTNKTSQGIDLFMTLSQMVVGLYDFTCFTQRNSRRIFRSNYASNYAIIVNGTDAYRDILVFVNGISKRTANVNINEGDNLTIVARAVGEATFVEVDYVNATGFAVNKTHTRVSCDTGFPCRRNYSDSLDNRDQLCTLTNAASNTDNQTLRFFVQYNEIRQSIIGEVNITVCPPPPTTSIITTSPTPTSSPTNKGDDSTNEVVIVVSIVVVVVVVLAIIILGLGLYFVHRWRRTHKSSHKSSHQQGHTGGKSSPDGSLRKLRVLIYSCDHSNIDPLVNKLKGKQEFEVEELIDDPSYQLSDNVSKLHSEISHGSVLIDCSCPGGTHTTMHTVVKSYTQKPSGDPDSSRWQIIQLNNCGTDVEIDPSWSKLYDHVEVMDYHTLDDVVDHVESKLIEYSHNRTSSIHSENEDNVSMKQQLLPGEELRPVGASVHKTTNEQVDNKQILEKVEGLAQGIESLAAQNASQHKELLTSVEDHKEQAKEQTETIGTQLDAIGKDTRALVNHQND